MKKILLVIAALVIVGGGLFLGFGSAKAVAKPGKPAQTDSEFTVVVQVHASPDSWCLANCVTTVGATTSRGEIKTQNFVYGTFFYNFQFRAPLENGWVQGGLLTTPGCCPNFYYSAPQVSGSWYQNDIVYVHVYVQ